MKAFKGTDANMCCNGFQYEIGKTYEHPGEVELCYSGFHACLDLFYVQDYYNKNSRFFEVEIDGISDHNNKDSKVVCSRLTFIRELTFFEVLNGFNKVPEGEINKNWGFRNIGNSNSGNDNIGNNNYGNYNIGNNNTGNNNYGNNISS